MDDPFYRIAATLDPSFKLKWRQTSEIREQTIMLVREEVHKVHTSQNIAQTVQSNKSAESSNNDDGKKPSKRKWLFDFMETASESQTESNDEVSQYLSDEDGSKHKSALLFWKKNEANYKALSKVTKKFLGVPATSGPVERVFSQAG